MVDQGCDIFYDDEVQLFYGRSKLTGIGLKSGRKIDCDAMILAIGTTPNLEIAKDCGLEIKRGVIVNERLLTSDPNIYAIGDCIHGPMLAHKAEDEGKELERLLVFTA